MAGLGVALKMINYIFNPKQPLEFITRFFDKNSGYLLPPLFACTSFKSYCFRMAKDMKCENPRCLERVLKYNIKLIFKFPLHILLPIVESSIDNLINFQYIFESIHAWINNCIDGGKWMKRS